MKFPSAVLLFFLFPLAAAAVPDPLEAYPAAGPGMRRHVLRLPEVAEPDAWRVEIIAGRSILADCNRLHFSASLAEEPVEGWGYPRYIVSPLRGPASTRMACPPEQARAPRFVAADLGAAALLRYNPRLPLVTYAPADVELRYRIWQAGEPAALPPE